MGSICFGSLFVAPIRTIRAILQGVRNKVDCLCCIEWTMRYFNHYAFTHIAIYGKTFLQSANATYDMFNKVGWSNLVNNNIISGVLLVGSAFSGLIVALFAGTLGYFIARDHWLLIALVSYLMGFIQMALVTEILESAVSTILVCFHENPECLQRSDPQLYELINSQIYQVNYDPQDSNP
eukprot:TRINITY_DN523_c0_g1_i1.p2 TRINITY_DN523_c0_g1~~TRINITY_DN523_c0_g1_i1.p2  ORF type:complete len:180 (+),score=26.70 TRINITY_DN523_c0_g1_i1:1171-1710(+)